MTLFLAVFMFYTLSLSDLKTRCLYVEWNFRVELISSQIPFVRFQQNKKHSEVSISHAVCAAR